MKPEKPEKEWNFDDGRAARYDRAVSGDHPLYARYEEVLDEVAARAAPTAGKRVLDIGTGTGNLARRCVSVGAAFVGLDPSEEMLAKAREKHSGDADVRFDLAPEPFLTIPFPEASFDAVISTYAFHHIPSGKKPKAIREMVRVLRPGGFWVLGDLIFENETAERAALQQYRWLEEEYFARIGELRPIFADLGMELQAVRFTPVTWVLSARKGETNPAERDME